MTPLQATGVDAPVVSVTWVAAAASSAATASGVTLETTPVVSVPPEPAADPAPLPAVGDGEFSQFDAAPDAAGTLAVDRTPALLVGAPGRLARASTMIKQRCV